VTDKNGESLITQTEAAELRGMSLAAVNQHVRSGRWRSALKYGKRLVYISDVVGFDPKTHKAKHTAHKNNQAAKKKISKK
jgi:hypothetical protein